MSPPAARAPYDVAAREPTMPKLRWETQIPGGGR
jgi:hypothetical protein